MRAPSDMPRPARRRGRRPGRGRILLVAIAVALFLMVTFARAIAGFYTDYLWFDSLGQGKVFRGVLGAKVALAAIFTGLFFALLFVNLLIADRIAPRFRPAGPEEDVIERYHEFVGTRTGLVRATVALLFGLIAGVGASSHWNDWILFTHRVDFGTKDPLFHTDVGFYVFSLPFLTFVAGWFFAALVIILIVTAVAHYLNGGIRLNTPLQRVTPQVKAHLSVLLGALALVKAAGYWLQRYGLTVSTRGTVDGATYTDVKIQLPAIYLLLMISLFAFALFIVNIFRRGWVLPVLAVGLWAFVAVVAGGIVPAIIQRFSVQPSESSKEAPYIQRNIDATRASMGLADVETTPFDYDSDLPAADLLANGDTIQNVRLLDPTIVGDTYQNLEGKFPFYRFNDALDVDRYEIDGQQAEVVLAVRELYPPGIPQKSWEGQHLAFTHGYAVALARANDTTPAGRPDFLLQGVPAQSRAEELDLTRPEVYFGEDLSGYAVVGTKRAEESGTDETVAYEGKGGVRVNSFLRKAAFALRFGDINPLISNFITSDSRVLYIRDVKDRVQTLAPFLSFDADPYPVIVDGRIVWVLDAYTTTDRYPYAQRANTRQLADDSGLRSRFNYVRNSVKAVVDAYDGSVSLYVMPNADGSIDPIARAYRDAFPSLFRDLDDMPAELQSHLRYPEDLFQVQTTAWGRYHLSDPGQFYKNQPGWSVAQDPGTEELSEATSTSGGATQTTTNAQSSVSTGSGTRRIAPYYLQLKLPGETRSEFVLFRPFVPFSEDDSRRQLTSFMVARSDPQHYGELRVFEVASDTVVDGPAIVASNIESDREIARQLTLLRGPGSEVHQGNLLIVPIENSLIYVRPVYVQASSGARIPELRQVIVVANGQIIMQPTLRAALETIFGTAPETNEGGTGEPTTPGEPTAPAKTAAELLAEADALFAEAEAALQDSPPDWATFGEKYSAAQDLLDQALDAARAEESSTGSSTSTTAPGTTSTTSTTAPTTSTTGSA